MKRKIANDLLFWKLHKTKQALLLDGARQVGKTYSIREFGQSEYEVFVEFNFLLDPRVKASFSEAANADDLAMRISVASDKTLIPGKTLVFFDEIQECPEILTLIKGLVDKGKYDYAMSGSVLGVGLNNVRSWPVGYVSEVKMFPMDFEEFCWAVGLSTDALDIARECSLTKTRVPDFVHRRLLGIFHQYLLVGGMPDAVKAFVSDLGIDQVRRIQLDIRRFYEADITQYAPRGRVLVIREIFRLIPSQLQDQNRRFKLDAIEGVKRFKQVNKDFLWLTSAGVALAAYNTVEPAPPLVMNDQRTLFKLFQSDVGLLTSTFHKKDTLELFDGRPSPKMGGVFENFVAQELAGCGFDLFYFTKRKIGELDFVIEDEKDRVVAIEVKSGSGYKTHAALDRALAVEHYKIDRAYVLAECNVAVDDVAVYMPVYMTGLLNWNA